LCERNVKANLLNDYFFGAWTYDSGQPSDLTELLQARSQGVPEGAPPLRLCSPPTFRLVFRLGQQSADCAEQAQRSCYPRYELKVQSTNISLATRLRPTISFACYWKFGIFWKKWL